MSSSRGQVGLQQGVLAIFALPTYVMGLPSSGSEKNIHSGAQALGQEGPSTDGRTWNDASGQEWGWSAWRRHR